VPRLTPVALVAGLYAPLGVLAPKGMWLLFLLPVLWQAGLAWGQGQLAGAFRGRLALLALAATAWALVSASWALAPWPALQVAASLGFGFAGLLVLLAAARALDEADRHMVERALVLGYVLAAALLAVDLAAGGTGLRWAHGLVREDEPFRHTLFNRRITVLSLAAWPALLVLWGRGKRFLALACPLLPLLLALAGYSLSARLAMVAALAAFALALLLPRLARGLVLGLTVAYIALVPALPHGPLNPESFEASLTGRAYSALHRLHIWRFSAERIAERPLAGWGMDASRRMPGGDVALPTGGNLMNMHPHNGSLQVWLELGGVGALLFAALAGLTAWAGRSMAGRVGQAAALAAFVNGFVVLNLSYGIWQRWWLATLMLAAVLLAAFAIRRSAGSGRDPAPP
jgi:O-antigen ligase